MLKNSALIALTISNQQTYDQAVDLAVSLAKARKRVEEFYAPLKKKARESWQALVDSEKGFLGPLAEIEPKVKEKIGTWDREQERIRKELEEQAEREAERISQEIALQTAIVAEKNGAKLEEVEVILSAPPAIPKPIVESTYHRDTRVSSSEHWSAECFDVIALARAVIAGQVPRMAIKADDIFLNQMARAQKGTLNYPGVKAVCKRGVSTRTR